MDLRFFHPSDHLKLFTAALLCLALSPVAAQTPETARKIDYCSAAPLTGAEKTRLTQQLEDRLGVSPVKRAAAALTLAGDTIARAQDDTRSCEKVFRKGAATFERQLNKQRRKVKRNAGAADSDDPAIAAVQQQLREAFIADQAARLTYLQLKTTDLHGADYWAQRLAMANAIVLDSSNTEMLEALLADYDWIDSQRFGNRIASHAWVIAQHADADPQFQQEVLQRMEPYLSTGGVRPRDYAYLYDRIAVNTGGLQRFGTQPMEECNADGSLSPKPLEAPQEVDTRRAEMGLQPMRDAMAEMASRRC